MNAMLSRIGGLFRHRWDPHVITVLDEQPLRYRALSLGVAAQAGEYLADRTLTHSLHRLIDDGLVAADAQLIAGRKVNLYRLTSQGRNQLAAYQSLIAAYERLTAINGHNDTGIWPHHAHSASPLCKAGD